MSSPVVSAERDTSICDLLLLAAETGVDHIVVTDGRQGGPGCCISRIFRRRYYRPSASWKTR